MRELLGCAILAAVVAAAGPSASRSSPPEISHHSASHRQPAAINADRVQLSSEQVRGAIRAGALDRDVRSLLKVDEPLSHGKFLWNDRNVPDGPTWLRVDLSSQLISVFRGPHEIGTAVILYGAEDKQTPLGKFHVRWKAKDHHSASYDAPMPYTLRLTDDGVAIHGSSVRQGRATHGCIGVPIEFAKLLFEEVAPGDEVVVIAPAADKGRQADRFAPLTDI